MMTFTQFTILVVRMRTAQRRYFKTRAYGDLMESKQLEKAVDQAAAKIMADAAAAERNAQATQMQLANPTLEPPDTAK